MAKPIQIFAEKNIVEPHPFEVSSSTDHSYSACAFSEVVTSRNSVAGSSKLKRQRVLCKTINKSYVCLALAISFCVATFGGLVWNIMYSVEIGGHVDRLDSQIDGFGKKKEELTGRNGPQSTIDQFTKMVMTTMQPALSAKQSSTAVSFTSKKRQSKTRTETATIPFSSILTSPNTTSTAASGYAFTVLQTKTVQYRGYDFLAVQLRVPSDGLSRSQNWCKDYQRLCADLAKRPVGCGSSYDRSPYKECKDFYGAHMYFPGHILHCPPSNIHSIAVLHGFPHASPEPSAKTSFGFYNCSSSACHRSLKGSHNALSSVDGFWEGNATTMYTVCVGKK